MARQFNLCTPAWWCESCQAWWPGSWVVSFGEPIDPETVDVEPYMNRTCAECGRALIPKARPV